jgi:hypothetical protein
MPSTDVPSFLLISQEQMMKYFGLPKASRQLALNKAAFGIVWRSLMDIISKSDHHQSPRSTISNHFSQDIIKRTD